MIERKWGKNYEMEMKELAVKYKIKTKYDVGR
jgi:hypothetical protein